MISAQNMKFVPIASAEALVDNTSFTTAAVDLKDWDYCTVIWYVGTTDIAMTALKVQTSDSSGSGYADVTGLVYGTSTDISGATSALPSATADGTAFAFDIDCRKVKRYIDVVATNDNGAQGGFGYGFAILSRGSKTPVTAAERGLANVLRI